MNVSTVTGCLFGLSAFLAGYSALTARERRLSYRTSATYGERRFPLRLGEPPAMYLACVFVLAVLPAGKSPLTARFVPYLLIWPGVVFAARLYRRRTARKRLDEFSAGWPDLLESMAVAALSGISLITALEVAARRTGGYLREELDKVIMRTSSGQSLGQALAALEKDIHVVSRLRSTLMQAEVLGTPVAEVLSALADEHYTIRRQEVEQRFNALPVKLTVVTVLFLLPPVLIISVMPHLLAFMGTGW